MVLRPFPRGTSPSLSPVASSRVTCSSIDRTVSPSSLRLTTSPDPPLSTESGRRCLIAGRSPATHPLALQQHKLVGSQPHFGPFTCRALCLSALVRRTRQPSRLRPADRHSLPQLPDRCDRTAAENNADSLPISSVVLAPVPVQPLFLRRLSKNPLTRFMSPQPTSLAADTEPGQLLRELEERQDDVLEQLNALDAQLRQVLEGLGVTIEDDIDPELL